MAAAKPPHVVGHLGRDGQWGVLLMVPFAGLHLERELTPDQAESLGRQLLEHSALVRDRLGLPGGAPFPVGG